MQGRVVVVVGDVNVRAGGYQHPDAFGVSAANGVVQGRIVVAVKRVDVRAVVDQGFRQFIVTPADYPMNWRPQRVRQRRGIRAGEHQRLDDFDMAARVGVLYRGNAGRVRSIDVDAG